MLALSALGFAPAVAAADPPSSLGLEATYDVSATLKWAKKRLFVVSVATVRNTTNDPVSELVFNFAPAQIGAMVMNRVLVGPDPATWVKDDQNVIVTLPAPLAPGQQTSVTIDYKSTFNTTSGGKKWLYAKLNGIVTAYRWIPWLSRVYDFATPTFGEPFVTQVSDEVRVSITVDRPGVVIASTGRRTGVNGLTQTFVANRVRDFNFTASPKYQTQSETWGDVSITYYYVNLPPDRLRDTRSPHSSSSPISLVRIATTSSPWPSHMSATRWSRLATSGSRATRRRATSATWSRTRWPINGSTA